MFQLEGPDRIIPEPIPVSELMELVTENEEYWKPLDETTLPSKSQKPDRLIIVPDTNIWISRKYQLGSLFTGTVFRNPLTCNSSLIYSGCRLEGASEGTTSHTV